MQKKSTILQARFKEHSDKISERLHGLSHIKHVRAASNMFSFQSSTL